MAINKKTDPFVSWFRQASPYIHAHRGCTFVVAFGGETVADECFSNLVQDLALLQSLGIKLVLVHGTRPQIEARLKLRKAQINVVNGLRVTDDVAMVCVREAAGAVRVDIEALLSMGVANSPMAGAELEVVSGNFVTAKPLGVIDGIDYLHTGEVRKIKTHSIQKRLDDGAIVLVSPIGYSPTGEVFNLNAADVASAIASNLRADKLIFLTEEKVTDSRKKLIQHMLPAQVDQMLERRKSLTEQLTRVLRNSADACRKGVMRSHLLQRKSDGILLSELFTRDGSGTLITAAPCEITRQANIDDVRGILKLIEPMEAAGVLVRRSRELIENEIKHFSIVELEGTIIACAALYPFGNTKMAELACLAVHQDYRDAGRGDKLLRYNEQIAKEQGLNTLFVLSTRTTHWFRERGFETASLNKLPRKKKDLYNLQRNSKMFTKRL